MPSSSPLKIGVAEDERPGYSETNYKRVFNPWKEVQVVEDDEP
jgi:hypothetical protein